MPIEAGPALADVRRLLEAAGLPTADLTGGSRVRFLASGRAGALEGVVGLEIEGGDALLRSLTVAPAHRGTGLGRQLVAAAERDAVAHGVQRIYLLTTTAADFFERLGYRRLPREEAPAAIRATSEFRSLCPASAVLMGKGVGGAQR
jgi:amino-acid N-acetyltransferase